MASEVKKLPHVELSWRDAVSHGDDWTVAEALASGTLCDRTSVGYLVGQTEDGRTLVAQTQDFRNGELRVTDVLVIPTPWVQRIRYLRGKPVKKQEEKCEAITKVKPL